jgi:hypothetical protein
MHGGIPQFQQFVVQPHQRDGIPAATETGEIVPDQSTLDPNPMLGKYVMSRIGEEIQFQRRCPAQPADQEQHAIVGSKGQISQDGLYEQIDDFRHAIADRTHLAGFTVEAYAQFD